MVYYNQYELVMRPEFPIIYPIIYQTFPVKVLYLKKKFESFPSGWGGGGSESSRRPQKYSRLIGYK